MTKTADIPAGTPIDLAHQVVGLERDTGRAVIVPQSGGPPNRIHGYTVGAGHIAGESPHGGELHPDADELLYLVSGRVQVLLELEGGDRTVDLAGGQALVVPRGVWHLIRVVEPGQLVNITPGPGGQHRPKRKD